MKRKPFMQQGVALLILLSLRQAISTAPPLRYARVVDSCARLTRAVVLFMATISASRC